MTKNASPANGEAMPSLNRRRLLLGLASASVAGAGVIAAGTVSASAAAGTIEDARLIQLGDQLPAVSAEYDAAYAHERAVLAKWSKRWPLAPDALTATNRGGIDWFGAIERGLTGAGLTRVGEEHPRRLTTNAKTILANLTDLRRTLARKRRYPDAPINWRGALRSRDEWASVITAKEALLAKAEAYDAGQARVLQASGYLAAKARHQSAHDALHRLIEEILAFEPRGMDGVLIQAQALAAWGRVERWRQLLNKTDRDWGAAFAASVMRIAEPQSSS